MRRWLPFALVGVLTCTLVGGEAAGRGLSFQQPGPLDMRLDQTRGQTAADLLRHLNERDLADLIYQYGEERFSRRIARRIVETRRQTPLQTTEQLADLVGVLDSRQQGARVRSRVALEVSVALDRPHDQPLVHGKLAVRW